MKATGIVRRIDELGRIVIPKEIRRSFRIKEGTPLEIFSGDNGELMLKKYSPMLTLNDFAIEVCESINAVTDKLVLFTDCEKVIGACGAGKKDFLGAAIHPELEKILEARKLITLTKKENNLINYINNPNIDATFLSAIIVPINSDGFAFGSIIILSQTEDLTLNEQKIAKTMALFITKQIG